jgi:hypothetical protein
MKQGNVIGQENKVTLTLIYAPVHTSCRPVKFGRPKNVRFKFSHAIKTGYLNKNLNLKTKVRQLEVGLLFLL